MVYSGVYRYKSVVLCNSGHSGVSDLQMTRVFTADNCSQNDNRKVLLKLLKKLAVSKGRAFGRSPQRAKSFA